MAADSASARKRASSSGDATSVAPSLSARSRRPSTGSTATMRSAPAIRAPWMQNWPTQANIVREFERLIEQVGEGDDVFIALAGHGSRPTAETSLAVRVGQGRRCAGRSCTTTASRGYATAGSTNFRTLVNRREKCAAISLGCACRWIHGNKTGHTRIFSPQSVKRPRTQRWTHKLRVTSMHLCHRPRVNRQPR